jgi:hypothetical protein
MQGAETVGARRCNKIFVAPFFFAPFANFAVKSFAGIRPIRIGRVTTPNQMRRSVYTSGFDPH